MTLPVSCFSNKILIVSIFEFLGLIVLLGEESFEHVKRWVQDVRDSRGDEAIMALVGNKLDLEEDR